MNLLAKIRNRFATALEKYDTNGDVTELIRPSQDPKFGDYQANCAMPLGKQLDRPAREIAEEIISRLDVNDFCENIEVAGPGFINLRINTGWLSEQLIKAVRDPRLGVAKIANPLTIVIDYSSPNVAKPMHVGHIRSTVIGDALARVLRFLGHQVITDNHLGDWGTQFGMVIYGYKHFVDRPQYQADPVAELSRLYKLVRKLIDYQAGKKHLPELERQLGELKSQIEQAKSQAASADKQTQKRGKKELQRLQAKLNEDASSLNKLRELLNNVEHDPQLRELANAHENINQAVLAETVKLHEGDRENLALWHEFLPSCRDEIKRIYNRLAIDFDHELGESFYHPMLSRTVESLAQAGLASESKGATCVFVQGFDTPMIVRKSDGAFLYATTDLATVQYRMEQWKPKLILYVVDHRQHEHFAKLFAVASQWGYDDLEMRHVSFGTVMGDDGKPFKTRDGDTVGLEGLLNEAVTRAAKVVEENSKNLEFTDSERQQISETVGLGALKYADLSQNRSSDYKFSYDKMLALNGNTAPYLQYSYARVQGIFRKGEIDIESLRNSVDKIVIGTDQERKLAIELLRFEEALQDVVADFRPNMLTSYLFGLAKCFMSFFESCPVLAAESDELKNSRLLLCDLTARTIKTGLDLLGIGAVERM